MRDQGVSAVEMFAQSCTPACRSSRPSGSGAPTRGSGDAPYPYGLSIGRVQAGDWASSVPDRLVAEGRYGVRLGRAGEAAQEAFEARLAAFCAADPWLAEHPVRLTWTGGAFASGELPAGHPLLPAVRPPSPTPAAARRRSGRSPRAATCGSTWPRASRRCTTAPAT